MKEKDYTELMANFGKEAEEILLEGNEISELRSNIERKEVLAEQKERRMEDSQSIEIEQE